MYVVCEGNQFPIDDDNIYGTSSDKKIFLNEKWILNGYEPNILQMSRELTRIDILNPQYKHCYLIQGANQYESFLERTSSSFELYEGIYPGLDTNLPKRLFKNLIMTTKDQDEAFRELLGPFYYDLGKFNMEMYSFDVAYIQTDQLTYVNYYIRPYVYTFNVHRTTLSHSIEGLNSVIYKILYRECKIYKDGIRLSKSRLLPKTITPRNPDLLKISDILHSRDLVSDDLSNRNKEYTRELGRRIPNIARLNLLIKRGVTLTYNYQEWMHQVPYTLLEKLFDKVGNLRFKRNLKNRDFAIATLGNAANFGTLSLLQKLANNTDNNKAMVYLESLLSNRDPQDVTSSSFPRQPEPPWKTDYLATMWEGMAVYDTYTITYEVSKTFTDTANWLLQHVLVNRWSVDVFPRAMQILARYGKHDIRTASVALAISAVISSNDQVNIGMFIPIGHLELSGIVGKILRVLRGKLLVPTGHDFIKLIPPHPDKWLMQIAVILSTNKEIFNRNQRMLAVAIYFYYHLITNKPIDHFYLGNIRYRLEDSLDYVKYISGKMREFLHNGNSKYFASLVLTIQSSRYKESGPLKKVGSPLVGQIPWARVVDITNAQTIGKGVYGSVMKSGKEAIKIQDSIQVFIRELAIMATLKNDNLQEAKGFDIHGDKYLIVMDLARGTLDQEIGNASSSIFYNDVWIHGKDLNLSKIPFEKKIVYSLDILRGLSALHSNGIIHGDIKPQNVLIGQDGVARITDFGLSSVGCYGYMDYTVRTCGIVTLWYRDINLLTSACLYYSFEIDVWSWVMIVMEVWTGVPPNYGCYEPRDVVKRYFDLLTGKQSWHRLFAGNLLDIILRVLTQIKNDRPTVDMCISSLS